jgi:diketogulonate reductase-like aldo/keto reductase
VQNRWHHTSGHDVSLLSSFSPFLSPNDFPLPGSSNTSEPQPGITYQPFWTLTGNPRLLASDAVQIIASTHQWTPEQVVYRFVAQSLGIPGLQATVLCGSTDEKHLREASEAVQGDSVMQTEEVESIRRVVYGE